MGVVNVATLCASAVYVQLSRASRAALSKRSSVVPQFIYTAFVSMAKKSAVSAI